MAYRVQARDWNLNLQNKFGECYSFHELSDTNIVDSIIEFGRAEITVKEDYKVIDFQNDYD